MIAVIAMDVYLYLIRRQPKDAIEIEETETKVQCHQMRIPCLVKAEAEASTEVYILMISERNSINSINSKSKSKRSCNSNNNNSNNSSNNSSNSSSFTLIPLSVLLVHLRILHLRQIGFPTFRLHQKVTMLKIYQ